MERVSITRSKAWPCCGKPAHSAPRTANLMSSAGSLALYEVKVLHLLTKVFTGKKFTGKKEDDNVCVICICNGNANKK